MCKRGLFTVLVCIILSGSFVHAESYHGSRRRNKFERSRSSTKATKIGGAIALAIPEPLGPKKLIAVANFENKTNWAGQANLGTGMADQLITSLIDTGRFIVLERQSIEAILREQDFGASSRTTSEGAAKIGKIISAQILIQGSITEFEQMVDSGGGAVAVQGFAFSASGANAHVAVDIRIYDTTTGQILASKACKGTARESGGSFGYAGEDFGFSAGGAARTPLDFAVREAINLAVDFVILELNHVPWEGRIAMVRNDNVYINCGRTAGIFLGDQFSVHKPGEPITDPTTGLNLGSEKTLIGMIEVIKVDEKFSKAIPISGMDFARSDIIKYEGPKPPPPKVVEEIIVEEN